MRMLFLTAVISMAAATAQAGSSIQTISTGKDDAKSIERVSCDTCPPLRVRKAAQAQQTALEPGTQKIEVREVGGELKVFRTEAWLGGSPVTYVSKATTDLGEKLAAEDSAIEDLKNATVTIDKGTTSAVTADMDSEPAPAEEPQQAKAFDPADLQLRLN